jgi:hypothetical protein
MAPQEMLRLQLFVRNDNNDILSPLDFPRVILSEGEESRRCGHAAGRNAEIATLRS